MQLMSDDNITIFVKQFISLGLINIIYEKKFKKIKYSIFHLNFRLTTGLVFVWECTFKRALTQCTDSVLHDGTMWREIVLCTAWKYRVNRKFTVYCMIVHSEPKVYCMRVHSEQCTTLTQCKEIVLHDGTMWREIVLCTAW